ncbi:GMC oxidoreductase-domain-containing protein [Nemania abortiva]|nr:GMC oxidoreductase-domain-containing protein [Nemania abortiva]
MQVHYNLSKTDNLKEVDIIVAGGGSAGCIIASRLADADRDLSILVIEGGTTNENVVDLIYPAFMAKSLGPESKYNHYYKAVRSEALGNRDLVVPTGGVLSGGSSVNLMAYTRAQRSDFDSWETYNGPDEAQCHGSNGPMQVSGGTFRSLGLEDSFVDAVRACGWPEIQNLQTMDADNGVQHAIRYVDLNRKRQDTANKYLLPRIASGRHPNLHVLLKTEVIRVILENQIAVGVKCQPNYLFQEATSLPAQKIGAKKMVIVSSRAFGSPLILERSSIEDPEILKAASIKPVTNLPGVSNNYQDHQLMVYSYKSYLAPKKTLNSIIYGRASPQDFPSNSTELPEDQYFSIAAFTPYPYSRGHIHVTGPTLKDAPNFDTGFFTNTHTIDIKKHLWFYKKQRNIVRRMTVFRGELEITHPKFPSTSKAACLRHNVGTTWHSMGTYKIAPQEKGGVVDHKLNIYGVKRLKVIDLSVPPVNMAANTNNTAIAIREKGASIYIKELGLGL